MNDHKYFTPEDFQGVEIFLDVNLEGYTIEERQRFKPTAYENIASFANRKVIKELELAEWKIEELRKINSRLLDMLERPK